MAKMSEEAKRKLREHANRKRANATLAKDYALADWLVFSDKVKEEHGEPAENYFTDGCSRSGYTFKYIKPDIIAALAKLLPHRHLHVKASPYTSRIVTVFPYVFVRNLMAEMNLDINKYCRLWSGEEVKLFAHKLINGGGDA